MNYSINNLTTVLFENVKEIQLSIREMENKRDEHLELKKVLYQFSGMEEKIETIENIIKTVDELIERAMVDKEMFNEAGLLIRGVGRGSDDWESEKDGCVDWVEGFINRTIKEMEES